MAGRFKYLLLFILASLLFLPNIGLMPLLDWFETGFAEASKEMVTTNDFFTIHVGGKPYIGFQPLFIWMQAVSMKIFGINEFAARFPNAICGVLTVIALFYIGCRLVSANFGLLWVLFYASSLIPFYFFKTGLIDPWHNLFVLLGMFCIYEFFLAPNLKRKDLFICFAAIFFGLAFLVNGLWALIILMLCLGFYFIVKMFNVKIHIRHILLFITVLILVSGSWFVIGLLQGNTDYVLAAYKYQFYRVFTMNTGREGFFPMYVFLVLMGVFPASILAFNIIRKQRKDDREPLHEFRNWMMMLFLVIIGFQLLMRPRISNYSTFVFIPLTFFATYVVSKLHELKLDFPKWTGRIVLLFSILSGVSIIGLEVVHYYKEYILSANLLKNVFVREVLRANVVVNMEMLIIGLVYISGVLTLFMLGKFSFFTKLIGILTLTLLFNYATFIFIFPHIEKYKQGVLIDFYKAKKSEDCYIVPLGFLSYGQFFYSDKQRLIGLKQLLDKQQPNNPEKPTYFIYKINEKQELIDKLGEIEVINQENGYLFVKRINRQNDKQ